VSVGLGYGLGRLARKAGSMKRSSVRLLSVCQSVYPSVRLSHRPRAGAACGGFAAERSAGRIYRWIAAISAQQQIPAVSF